MNRNWIDSGRYRRVLMLGGVPLLLALLAGCTPTLTPTNTPLPVATLLPPTAVVVASTAPTATASDDVDVMLNVGGGVARQSDGTVDIVANGTEVTGEFVMTVTVPIVCASDVKEPLLNLSGEGGVVDVPMNQVGSTTAYQAVFRMTDPVVESIVSHLCTQPLEAVAELKMSWKCGAVPESAAIGRLLCGHVDLTDKVDPRGGIGGHLDNDCPGLSNIRMTIYQVDGIPMAAADNRCAAAQPTSGWQWSLTPPALPGPHTKVAFGDLDPKLNPMFTNTAGDFAWNAKPGLCYYVQAFNGSCPPWYSQAFLVDELPVLPVEQLNLWIEQMPPPPFCNFTTTNPCP